MAAVIAWQISPGASVSIQIKDGVEDFPDELGTMPALLTGHTYDILGWNRAATLVFGDFERIPASECNVLWLLFSKTRWSKKIRLFAPRDQYAKEVLETFRSRITGHQADPSVQAFIERLQQASPTFRDLWVEHNVRSTRATRKQLQHPLVGKMTLDYAKFQVIEHPDIRCHMYLAADSETAQQLHRLLKSVAFVLSTPDAEPLCQ